MSRKMSPEQKEKDRLRHKAWWKKNKHKCKEYTARYRKKYPGRARAFRDDWARRHPEKIRAYRREYYYRHQQARIEFSRKYRATNPNYKGTAFYERVARKKLLDHYIIRCMRKWRQAGEVVITPQVVSASRKRIQAIRSQKLLRLFYAANAIAKAAA